MRQREGERHIGVGFVVGVAEHHALVASPLFVGVLTVNAAVDVGALLVDGTEDAAAFGFKFILGLGVTDAFDGVANDFLKIDGGRGFNFSRHNHLTGGHEGFASYF